MLLYCAVVTLWCCVRRRNAAWKGIAWRGMEWNGMARNVLSCRVVWCRVMSCGTGGAHVLIPHHQRCHSTPLHSPFHLAARHAAAANERLRNYYILEDE